MVFIARVLISCLEVLVAWRGHYDASQGGSGALLM